VFSLAGNPNKPIVGPTRRPGISYEQYHPWQSEFQTFGSYALPGKYLTNLNAELAQLSAESNVLKE
jgi:hypothetical protein